MALSMWEPFRDDFFSDALRSLATASSTAQSGEPASYGRGILMDIKESEGDFQVKADIPGVPKEAIKVNVDHNVLTVSVQQENKTEDQKEEAGVRWHRSERSSSFMRRSIRMPETADLQSIKAKYDNGVLNLDIPKHKMEKQKTRTVQIE